MCVVVRLEFAIIAGGLLGLVALVLVGLCQPKATKQGRATVTHISKVLLLGWAGAGGRAAAWRLRQLSATCELLRPRQTNKQPEQSSNHISNWFARVACSDRGEAVNNIVARRSLASLLAVFWVKRKTLFGKIQSIQPTMQTHVADEQNITEALTCNLYLNDYNRKRAGKRLEIIKYHWAMPGQFSGALGVSLSQKIYIIL